MDCRGFHRNLEDYLEDGLDFPGRFGMERHVQQCVRCGKVLSNAQQLRQMIRRTEKVKAPVNFESIVLNEIGKHGAEGRFFRLRRFWVYGFETLTVRRLVWVSSCLAVVALGVLYLYPVLSNRTIPGNSSVVASQAPATVDRNSHLPPARSTISQPAIAAVIDRPERPITTNVPKAERMHEFPNRNVEPMVDQEFTDTDYLEFHLPGPDNQPVRIRWPNRSRTRYGQTPEEYFIRNVSH